MMTHRKVSGGLILAIALAISSSAVAAPTVTTPALGAFGTNRLVCTVTNVSKKDVDVTVQVVSETGTILANVPFTIEPGKASGAGTGMGPTQGFCRVTGASKSKVRVALCVTDSVLNCLAAVPGQ
jgi:hypothetical protein